MTTTGCEMKSFAATATVTATRKAWLLFLLINKFLSVALGSVDERTVLFFFFRVNTVI